MNPTDHIRRHTFEETLLSARRTMVLSEILKLAVDSFRSSKMRFALTALGMVIGTASVILVVTIGLTGKQFILQEIAEAGDQLGRAGILRRRGHGHRARDLQRLPDPRRREGRAGAVARRDVLLADADDARPASALAAAWSRIRWCWASARSTRQIRNLIIPVGRFLDETDDSAHIKCAVVTENFARDRFGSTDAAVGQNFEISGIPFTIIGVFKESVDDFGHSEIQDQTILIPYSVARYFTGTENVNQIYFSMRSMDEVPDAAKEIVRIVQARHRPNSVYQAQTLKEVADDGRQDCRHPDRWCWWLSPPSRWRWAAWAS